MKQWECQSLSVSDSLQPRGLYSTRLLCLWNSIGKNNAVGSHSLFQGIFLTQGLNLDLMHCRQMVYHLSHQERLKTYIYFFFFFLLFFNVLVFLLIQFTMNITIKKNLKKRQVKLFYYKYRFQFYFLFFLILFYFLNFT